MAFCYNRNMKEAILRAFKNLGSALPIFFGVLMAVSLVNSLFSGLYPRVFTGSFIWDPLIGAAAGSLSFGMPIVSYVIGGELLSEGVSLAAVRAFILAWSTVGFAMLPLEIKYLGRSFALKRNGLNFVFAIIISVLTIAIMKFFV